MKIHSVTNPRPQAPPLASSQTIPYPFTLSATTAPAASAPTSTSQSVAAAMPMPPIKSEKPPAKRRRRATANSHNNQQAPSDNQDSSSAPPKRRKHQKAPSSSSNHPSANSTPNLGYAPVPTPPLSTTSNPSSLSNVVDQQPVLSQIQNTPALQNHSLDPSPRSYPNILSNQVQTRQMSPRSQAQVHTHQNQLLPHHLQQPFSDSQAYQNLRSETLETWIALGSAFDGLDNYDKAISCFEKVLKIDQHNLTAIVGIAAQYRSKGLFPKAIDYYLAATKIDGSQGAVWEALAHCYLMVEELGESYKAYQRAINILPDPNVPKLWYGIAILYDRCGSFDLAKEAFSKVLDIDPNYNKKADIYFRLGIIFKQEHKYHKALENFNLVLKNPPPPLAISDIWFQIGHIQETLEDFPAAQYAYERVLEDNPSHAKVLQQLGWLHYQQSMKGTNQLVLPSGAVQLTMDLAIARLSQSLDYEPEDAYTWYLLGRCYMQQDKHADAYRAYSRAVAIDSENPIFWCSIGILYYRTGEFRVALDSYTRSIRLAPEALGEAWYNAAILYEVSNNQISDAVSALENAIKFDPSNQVYTTHLNTLVREVQQLNGGAGLAGPNGELRSLLPEELRIPREPPVPVDRPLPSHPSSASNIPPPTSLESVQQNPQAAQHIDPRPDLASPQIYANVAPQTNGQMAAGTYVPIAPAPAGSPGAPSGLPRP